MPDLSAIVVNFNSGEYLSPCLESLSAEEDGFLSIERLVVDNASTLEQGAFLDRALASGARVIRSPVNLGYGGGCNLGLRETTGRFVLFLNADVKARAGCLRPLVRLLEERDDVAFVEPRTFLDDARTFLIPPFEPLTPRSLAREFARRVSSRAASRLARARVREALPAWLAAEPVELQTLTGAFLMTRRATIRALGGFDEGYPLYFEDSDLFRRARAEGGRLLLAPEAEAIHYAHRSSSTAWEEAMAKQRAGRRRYLRSSAGAWAVALDAVLSAAACALERFLGPSRVARFIDLGERVDEPELVLDGLPGPFLIEIAAEPSFALAAAHFGVGDRFRMPRSTWRSLMRASWYLRALDQGSLSPRGAWRVRKA